jgi:hypothetical protein
VKLQKNLLIIAILFALVWGVLGLFFPSTVAKLLNYPTENLNNTLKSMQMTLGIAQISLGIVALWMRTLKDKAALGGAMAVVAVIFLLFGLDAVLKNMFVEGLTRNTFLFGQGILFIVLAILFFVLRKPK